MDVTRRAVLGLGLVVCVLTLAVYLMTLAGTVPFWDSGEFIAVSNILGIPHPPGTPFYVLIGRLATLVPFATIAQRVNALSAVASVLAVLLSFLTTYKLIRLVQGPDRRPSDDWIALAGAGVGALLLAFSDTFWENATEAEVYSMMSLAQILVFWLGLNWWEAHEKTLTAGPLLVCVYLMWLSVGLHLGVGMMGLPLLVLVFLVDRRAALVFTMPLISVLFVTWGLERMAGAVIALSSLTFLAYAGPKKLNGWVMLASIVAALIGVWIGFTDTDYTPATAAIAAGSVLVPLTLLARKSREGKIIALALLLMAAGYSTHLYLPIRAAQHPAINEGNPSNWQNLRDLLERKQYGSTSMFVRRAPWSVQLDKEFWRYFQRQWPLFPSDRMWAALLPLLLGIAGAVWQARREKISFLSTSCLFLFATVGMIIFLNFTDHEVRDRDYFFTTGYHAFALWIGMGAAWLITWVRDSFEAGASRSRVSAATTALMCALPALLAKNLWFTHDRHRNFVARDYAYNMLAPLAKDSFVYTNGDNDTFPLWYMQQVEDFRKDVRVVNLSLLNTDWYIFQLRDEEPRMPIVLDNATIHALGQGAFADEHGNVIYTNQYMVQHIMGMDRVPNDGWKKPPYFAVTVPDHQGFDKHFSLEGLVYRVNPDTTGPDIDVEKTRHNLYEVFKYRGLFREDGSWDSTVFKDENASTLSRNYAAAHLQLAFWYQHHGELPKAIAEMERVERMFPGYVDVLVPLGRFYLDSGDTAKALALFERLARDNPRSAEANYYYGVASMFSGSTPQALAAFDRTIQADPNYLYAYLAAYSLLWEMGQHERALSYLQRWVNDHPDDPQTRALLEGPLRQSRGGQPPPAPPPLPGGP